MAAAKQARGNALGEVGVAATVPVDQCQNFSFHSMRDGGHCGNVTKERDDLLFQRVALAAELGQGWGVVVVVGGGIVRLFKG